MASSTEKMLYIKYMTTMESDRLIIRDFVKSDLQEYFCLVSCRTAMHYLPEIYCAGKRACRRQLYIAIREARRTDRTKYFFAAFSKASKSFLGSVGFTVTRPGFGHLGYFYKEQFWGKGFATEAARAVLRFAFENIRIHKIASGCIAENHASEHVMMKCGMVKEADFKQHVYHEGKWKDRVEYGITRKGWLESLS